MDGRHFEKSRNCHISQQRLDRSARNLAQWYLLDLLSHRSLKFGIFKNLILLNCWRPPFWKPFDWLLRN